MPIFVTDDVSMQLLFLIVSAVIIEFNPAIYIVPEGESRTLRIVKIGESAVNVSVLISTVDGTAMSRLKL